MFGRSPHRPRTAAASSLVTLLSLVVLLHGGSALATSTWTPAGSLSTARSFHTATALADGKVLVTGGSNAYHNGDLASADLFDPVTDTWSAAGALNTARFAHTATALPDGRVLVTGGISDLRHLASAEIYDPATDAWSSAGEMSTPRTFHDATLLPDGRVLVTGGHDRVDLSSAEIYSPATNTWSLTGEMSSGRSRHAATALSDGTVLVTGGEFDQASAEIYDPATGTWSSAGSMSQGRAHHTATALSDGTVLVAGGRTNSSTLRSVEVYDPATRSWSAAESLAAERSDHTATALLDGSVLVAGGDQQGGVLSSAEVFDPGARTWTPAGSMTTSRVVHASAALPDGDVLVTGGLQSFETTLSTAEVFTSSPAVADGDDDGVADDADNCPAVSNPGQRDSDGDSVGNSCEVSYQRSLTLDLAHVNGPPKLKFSGRVRVAGGLAECVQDVRVVLERRDVRRSAWERVGSDRTSSNPRPGRFVVRAADATGRYRARATAHPVTVSGSSDTCAAASVVSRHAHR